MRFPKPVPNTCRDRIVASLSGHAQTPPAPIRSTPSRRICPSTSLSGADFPRAGGARHRRCRRRSEETQLEAHVAVVDSGRQFSRFQRMDGGAARVDRDFRTQGRAQPASGARRGSSRMASS